MPVLGVECTSIPVPVDASNGHISSAEEPFHIRTNSVYSTTNSTIFEVPFTGVDNVYRAVSGEA